jgi:hypothetical protein
MTRVTKWETWCAAAVSWLSAALLVWTAHSNLAAWVFQEVGEHQRFTLVVDRTLKNPRSTGHHIWFREVLVDGHHLLSRDILVEGAWKALGERGYHAAAPATASFTGRSAVVELLGTPEAGIAKVRDNRREALVDAYSPWTFMVHGDLPVWTRPWWSWALFFAPVLGSIVVLRPWRSRRRTDAWLLLSCAGAHAIVWCTIPVETNGDTVRYYDAFRAALERGAPHHYSIGYGILMALVDALPGASLGAKLTLAQHGMMMATLLMMWRLVRLYASWWLAAAWFFATTWLAPTLLLPQNLLSENLALLAMVGATYFTQRVVDHGGLVMALLAGFALGLATLTRAVPLVVTGPAMWLMFLIRHDASDSTTLTAGRVRGVLSALVPRDAMRRSAALAFGTAAVIVLAPMCWYVAHGHRFGLTTGVGRHFYNRIVYEQNLIDRDGPATKALQQLMPGADLTTLGHWMLDPKISNQVDRAAADSLIARVAKEALLTDPVGYLVYTFELTWRNLVANPTLWLLHAANTDVTDEQLALQTEPLLRYSAGAGTWAEYGRRAHKPLWAATVLFVLLAVAVLPWAPRRQLIGALLCTVFGYMLACSAVEFPVSRYNACITPFVTAAAVVPLAAIDLALRRRRPSPGTAAEPPATAAAM